MPIKLPLEYFDIVTNFFYQCGGGQIISDQYSDYNTSKFLPYIPKDTFTMSLLSLLILST